MRHRGPVSDYLSTARKGGHHKGKFLKFKSCAYSMINLRCDDVNRSFPNSLAPLFPSESKCETIFMKMILVFIKIKLHAELIFA